MAPYMRGLPANLMSLVVIFNVMFGQVWGTDYFQITVAWICILWYFWVSRVCILRYCWVSRVCEPYFNSWNKRRKRKHSFFSAVFLLEICSISSTYGYVRSYLLRLRMVRSWLRTWLLEVCARLHTYFLRNIQKNIYIQASIIFQ